MEAADEKLLAKAKQLVEHLRPGVVSRLEGLGCVFRQVPVIPHVTRDKGNVSSIQAGLSCYVPGKRVLVNITMTCIPGRTPLDIVQCAYHCGPSDATEEVYFRICDNKDQRFHFHIRGHGGDEGTDHIPASKAKPQISTEPMPFLDLVEAYLATGKIPLEVLR